MMNFSVTSLATFKSYQSIIISAFIVLLLYTLFIAFGSLEGFPSSMATAKFMPYLADKPVGEDGYYMLTVAWNIASGNGISIRPGEFTTGIQPLATFVYAAIAKFIIFYGGDRFDLPKWIIIFGGVNQIGFSLIMGMIARSLGKGSLKDRNLAFAITVIIVATSFYLFRMFTYGLETGIYLTLFALLTYLSLKIFSGDTYPTKASLIIVGTIAGLTGLARIDFGVIFAVFIVVLLIFKRIRLNHAIIFGLTAFIVVFPWLAWVKSISGHWIPSSGIAQSSLINLGSLQSRIFVFFGAISENLVPSLYTGGKGILAAIAAVPTFIGIYLIIKSAILWNEPEKVIWLAWLLGCCALILLYPVFFWATHFYFRYTATILVITLPVMSLAISERLLASEFFQEHLIHTIVLVSIFLVSLNAVVAVLSLHAGKIGNSHSVSAGYVQQHLPESAVVGAFQSGVIGYYNENTINLDGKVNPDVLGALASGQVNDYALDRKIDYIIDWIGLIETHFLKISNAEKFWQQCKISIPNDASICINRLR